MNQIFKVLIVILAGLYSQLSFTGDVMIHDAWVREAPPNAQMLAGYFSVMNMSKHDKIMVGASSLQFKNVGLHRSIKEGDMAKMVAQKEVVIPAGQTVKFEPGSYHLMLMHPVKRLKTGDMVEFTINFKSGDTMKFDAPVKKSNGDQHMDEHKHMHM